MSATSSTQPASRAYLEHQREENGNVRVTPGEAFRGAVRNFVKGPRLDLGKLASELGVSKATLYRWTGSREQLLSEVLTYLGEQAVAVGREKSAGLDGQARVEAFFRGFIGAIVNFDPLRHFVRSESPLAFRILTTRGGLVQTTVANRVTEMLDEEVAKGTLTARVPTADLGYAMIRVVEAFIYNDAMADINTDTETAVQIVCLLID